MDVVLKCYKSAVMKFQNKAMHHHLIDQPDRDLILQSRTESRKSCLCTVDQADLPEVREYRSSRLGQRDVSLFS